MALPPDDRRCTAKNRQTGERCGRWALRGAKVCYSHGGQLPSVKAAAARNEARRRLAIPDAVDPRDALADELARTIAWVGWLGQQVDAVDDATLVWGRTKQITGLVGLETTVEARPSVWWAEYRAERKHLIEVARTAHACGVEDRRVELMVHQAELLVAVVTGMAVDLGHDPDDPGVKKIILARLAKAKAIEVAGVAL